MSDVLTRKEAAWVAVFPELPYDLPGMKIVGPLLAHTLVGYPAVAEQPASTPAGGIPL
jgi:hypothetical protein